MARLEDFQFRHDGMIHTFKLEATEAKFQSSVQKRKVYVDQECLEILIPGSKNQVNFCAVDDDLLDRKGIREFYDKWKSGDKAGQHGTPIAHFDELSPGQIKSLESNAIKTIEAFAEMDDSLLTLVGPEGRTLRDKARVIVGFSEDEGVKRLQASNEMLTKEMADLRALVAQLQAAKPEPKGKGKKADPMDPFGTEQAA